MCQSLSGPNSPPPFKLTFGAILAWASVFKAATFVFKNPQKGLPIHHEGGKVAGWPLKGKDEGVCVCECVGGIQYCRLCVNGLGLLECKL